MPEAPAATRRTGTGIPAPRGRLADPPVLAVLAACAVILACRRAGAVTHPQFWAEDAYFFAQAYTIGWSALLVPFAGYLHTIPRLVGEVAVLMNPARGPAIFVAGSAAVTLYVASRTLSPRCPLPRWGGACALAVVLVPDTYEVLLNVVNLQWVVGAGIVLLLVSADPRTPAQRVHDVGAGILMGLTGPFSILLAPLFLWRAWSRRTRASAGLAALVLACALLQGYLVHREPAIGGPGPGDRVAARLFLPAIGRRIGGSLLLGALLPTETRLLPTAFVGAATLAGAAFLAFRRGPGRPERLLLGLAFFALLGASLYRTRYTLYEFLEPLAHARYVFLPQLILLWLLLCGRTANGIAGRIAPLLFAWAVLVNLPRYREPAYLDLHWELYEDQIRAGQPVVVPINPPGWVMPLPARRP